jgi:single stranded DNA-binding protein
MINATVRGNVGNVDLKNMPSGDPVLEISIASNDRGKGGTEVTTWVRATVFGKRAESLSRVVKKGDSLLVVGPLSVREFESKGEKRFSVEVKVDQLDFCGGGGGGFTGAGVGGTGGGGAGSISQNAATAGTVNTGGGGGGCRDNIGAGNVPSGAGGSGIVIIRYPTP